VRLTHLYAGLLALFIGTANAATLEKVRVFTGDGHARVLLIADEPIVGMETRSSAATAIAPPRATLILPDTTLGPEVGTDIPVEDRGIRRCTITDIGGQLQFTVEMDEPRVLRARALGERAVLVDLRIPGRRGDPSLPTPEQLEAWLGGVSLERAAGTRNRRHKLVVVDPGHGGFDHGAIGTRGTREADIALEIARRTARALRDRLGVEVLLTRDSDEFIPLRDRSLLANQENADLFLSIHANAAPNNVARGIETYSLANASDASAARVATRENAMAKDWDESADPLLGRLLAQGTDRLSKDLAHEIQRSVISNLNGIYGEGEVVDLGTKTAMFYVLVMSRMPAILFEASFVSNPIDERRLRTPHFQQAIADAIVESVGTWFSRQKEE
jgi:N-acetylmuramoyl-L-alanine amidase